MVRAARKRPDALFIGLDADPSRMRRASRHAPANALFVVAAAEAVPTELDGMVARVSIHFPWGSLLRGLVAPTPEVLGGIARSLRPDGTLTALLSIDKRDGAQPLGPGSIDRAAYRRRGLEVTEWRLATPAEIELSDSSWAKRLRTSPARSVWHLGASRLWR